MKIAGGILALIGAVFLGLSTMKVFVPDYEATFAVTNTWTSIVGIMFFFGGASMVALPLKTLEDHDVTDK